MFSYSLTSQFFVKLIQEGTPYADYLSYPLKNTRAVGVDKSIMGMCLLGFSETDNTSIMTTATTKDAVDTNYALRRYTVKLGLIKSDGTLEELEDLLQVSATKETLLATPALTDPTTQVSKNVITEIQLLSSEIDISTDTTTYVGLQYVELGVYVYPVNSAQVNSDTGKLEMDFNDEVYMPFIRYNFQYDRYVNPYYQLSDGTKILGLSGYDKLQVGGSLYISM